MVYKVYGSIDGPIVMIGYGSIGRGLLPLLERHVGYDPSRFTVIDPMDYRDEVSKHGVAFMQEALTPENHRDILTSLLGYGPGRGFCINLSVDVSSLDVMETCRHLGALYIDTVIEPWPGFYFDVSMPTGQRTNYAMRERLLDYRRRNPGGPTAVSCCGANPGMVSWFTKKALIDIKRDLGFGSSCPTDRNGWAALARNLGVKGIHISERDTQVSKVRKNPNQFVNTWSVDGFISEGLQPAELGWGTHEKWLPSNAETHEHGCGAAIFINQPGADTRVRTWVPSLGSQHGLLVTHNESISISDYLTVSDSSGNPIYRPTCHYAYHPCDDAILSFRELFGKGGEIQPDRKILSPDDIESGMDELGVFIYGHGKNAYWYGSRLTIDDARSLAPNQNATGLQVTSAVLAGIVWTLENPTQGVVEADEMDHARCLEVQTPYLGVLVGEYTDWTPLDDSIGLFDHGMDLDDPWQFRNVLVKWGG